jgi:nucleotide-binding universal stress UspA family protein
LSFESYDFPVDSGMVTAILEKQARQELKRLAKRCGDTGVRSDSVVRVGAVQAEILRGVQDFMPDLVVIGRRRRGKVERWFLGSVAERLLRALTVPVMIAGENSGAIRDAKRLLVPTDLSADSAYEIAYAAALARETRGTVTVLHVIADLPAGFALPNVHSGHDVQREIERLIPRTARRWCRIVTRVETGIPYRKILEAADKGRADLILMNIHGKGMLERALVGSTADRVIRGARCPVIALPPGRSLIQKKAA